MSVNKVVISSSDGEETLVDLTGDSVTEETLGEGITAHDASGNPIVGKMPTTAVLYTKQSLDNAQQQQARRNIAVPSTWEVAVDMLFMQGMAREWLWDDGSISLAEGFPTFGPRYANKFIATSVDKKDVNGNPITLVLDLENYTAQFVSVKSPGGEDANRENYNEVQTTPYRDGDGNTFEFGDVFDGEFWYIDPCFSVFSVDDGFYIKRWDSDER